MHWTSADRNPVLGEPPDFAKHEEDWKGGSCVRRSDKCPQKGRCPSEQIAKNMVRDVITSYEDDKMPSLSCFCPHIARVKTIAECAHGSTKPLLLGRSMERYCVAEQMKMVRFPDTTSVFGNRRVVERTLRRLVKSGRAICDCYRSPGERAQS